MPNSGVPSGLTRRLSGSRLFPRVFCSTKIVHGTSDSLVPVSQARTLHQALLSAGLDHVYEEHAGDHQFFADRSLTFLSQALVGTERYISPPLLTLTGSGVDAQMRLSTQAGVDYRSERTASLDATNLQWTQFEAVKGTGQVAQISIPINANNGFFRVSASNTSAPSQHPVSFYSHPVAGRSSGVKGFAR